MVSDQQPQATPAYDPDSESDFSDAEDEESGIYLGLPDGPLEGEDESNPLVSRLGGLPAWLPFSSSTSFFHTSSDEASTSAKKLPLPPSPAQVSQCKICGKEMEMLVQVFAPLEGSCFDRTINVWGCSRAGCQKQRDSRR
jgi:pre-rRNA-processing protein TSR4